ncbi:BcPKS7, polyketide synthase, partial sequence [Botrytis cinerea T4]|uniref:BcPKS7, polyketide synthase, partial sequence n=1 Tax=Botryotinia fuckeliana (strain T4) TaxID=999810 RepID=G2XPS5_BOTF4
MLLAILTGIIYESLFSNIDGTIWFHNVDECTTEIIETIANCKDASVFLTTSNIASKLVLAGRVTYIHPRVTEHELIRLSPWKTLKGFVDMGNSSDELVELIESISGDKLNFHRNFHRLSLDQHISLLFSKSSLVKILADYCSRPELLCDVGRLVENNIIKAGLLHEQKGAASATSIVSWTGAGSVHVQVAPATHDRLFKNQKTYLLIGLAGEVGLSLREWMINCGARYLAIAGRNPTVPPEIRKAFEQRGAIVRIFSMNVADMEILTKVHHEMVSFMPPIARVSNGALVVRDHPFDALLFEDLETVFKPKIVGTQTLDKFFFSTPLDFFILFSSIATVVGKPGQSSYVAANLFMSALAGQRRKRSLAASVMHFGTLFGFGCRHGQTGPLLEARFRQEDCWAIQEPEFHVIFAQAIISGRPENNLDPDVIAGLGTEIETPWRAISRFSHCRVIREDKHSIFGNQHCDNEQQQTQGTQDCLKESRNCKEAYAVLKTAIAGKISLALGCPIENVGEYVGLISLGLDSLLTVEIRSWILKILEADMTVLKLLGGLSLSDTCHSVVNKLPISLKTWIQDNESHQNEPN